MQGNNQNSFGLQFPSCPPPRPPDFTRNSSQISFPSHELPKPPTNQPVLPNNPIDSGGFPNVPLSNPVLFQNIPQKPLPKPGETSFVLPELPSAPQTSPNTNLNFSNPILHNESNINAANNYTMDNKQRIEKISSNNNYTSFPNLPPVPMREMPSPFVKGQNASQPRLDKLPNAPQKGMTHNHMSQQLSNTGSINSQNYPSQFNAPPIPKRDNLNIHSMQLVTRSQTSPITRNNQDSKYESLENSKKWKIEPLKKLKLSKTKRPEITIEQRLPFVSQNISNNIIQSLRNPPDLILQFQPSICFEIVFGKLFDANYEFFPQPKPPNRFFTYCVQVVIASEPERSQAETQIGEIRLIRLDHQETYETIPLHPTLPCMELRPRVYLFRSAGPRFFIIEIPANTNQEQIEHFDNILLNFSLLHRMNPKGKFQEVNIANTSAAAINSGGEVLGKGIAKGSALVGRGFRNASKVVTKNTTKHQSSPKIDRELSEDEIKKKNQTNKTIQTADKASSAFVTGTRGVKVGIKKGFGFVGRSGAQIADGSSKVVKKTDWYQEREAKKLQEKPKDPDKGESNLSGALNIAKSSLNAGSSVISGIKQGTRTVAKDVRESTVELAEHVKGEEVGQKTRQGFNIAGKTALGGAFVFQLTAVESWHCIAYTGVGAATYDPDKKEILSGIAWKVGWMTKQGSYMNPWSPRFAVLRTYSIAFYKDPKHVRPTSYIPLEDIRSIEFISPKVTEKQYCISIQTKSDIYLFSLDLGVDICTQLEINRDLLPIEHIAWRNTLLALQVSCKISKFKKIAIKKQY